MTKHSYSAIKSYENCPRAHNEIKILKKYPRQETEQTIYGTRLHAQAEEFIKHGKPVDPGFEFMTPMLEAIMRMEGVIHAELEMAVTESLRPCDFRAEDYWLRGIADVVVINEENLTARVFDFKSGGNKYPDTDQLMLMALLIFEHYPLVRQVSGGLLFVLKNTYQRYRTEREKKHELWWKWRERVAKLDAAIHNDIWNPKQSGLCAGYCPVVTCEFASPKRVKR